MKLTYIVGNEKNIRQILKEHFNFSERLIKKVKEDYIYINDEKSKIYTTINKGDILSINLGYDEFSENIIPNANIKFNILYEDEWMLIVNKNSGMPVHPSLNYYENSLSNGVKYYFNSIGLNKKIRPVNRLDKDTSGIVIFAKSEYIQENLKDYKKEYLAVVEGKLLGNGKIDKPIARKNQSIIERCVDENGEKAITHYQVIKNFKFNNKDLTLIRCQLETGRTHQIRVHFSSIGYPILGDTLYGNISNFINRQALHAYHICFIHPVTKQVIDIYDKIPKDILIFLHN